MTARSFMRFFIAFTLSLSLMAGAGSFAYAEESGAEAAAEVNEESGGPVSADEWLPIGSVVTIRGYSRSFMVLGRVVQNAGDSRYYDYCACLYPDGYMGGDLYFFYQKDIDEVLMKGFEDEYEKLYRISSLDGIDTGRLTETDAQTEAPAEGQSETAPAAEGEEETAQAEAGETQGQTQPAAETQSATETQPAAEAQPAAETQPNAEAQPAAGQAGRTFTATENVRLRADASTDSESLITVPGGRELIEDTTRQGKDDWVPVIFTDSTGKQIQGYVKQSFLQEK